jgi:hypothetical protein
MLIIPATQQEQVGELQSEAGPGKSSRPHLKSGVGSGRGRRVPSGRALA